MGGAGLGGGRGAESGKIRRSEQAKAGERPDRAAAKGSKQGGSFMFVRFALAAALLAAGVRARGRAGDHPPRRRGAHGLAIAVPRSTSARATATASSVAVVDRAGRLRVFLQSDRANPHNIELARRKAYTARTFGRTSAEWAKRTTEMPSSPRSGARRRHRAAGGVPIKIGNETIGAVGVSGSSSKATRSAPWRDSPRWRISRSDALCRHAVSNAAAASPSSRVCGLPSAAPASGPRVLHSTPLLRRRLAPPPRRETRPLG